MKFPVGRKYLRTVAVSLTVSAFTAFVVWCVFDYLTYYGGAYEQSAKGEIDAFDRQFRTALGENINEPLAIRQYMSYIQLPAVFDLTIASDDKIIYTYANAQRWQYRCCNGYYLRSTYVKTYENYSYIYAYYAIPRFHVSFLRAITFSILPDRLRDKRFSFAAWKEEFIDHFWARSFVYYGMFCASFITFFAWSIRRLSYDEKREIAYETLSEEMKRIEVGASRLETHKSALREINKTIGLKKRELSAASDRLKQSGQHHISTPESIDAINKEIIALSSERDRLEREFVAINESLVGERENIQDTQIDARIADIRVEFSQLFGAKMPNALIDQISEGFYLYERSPEYTSQIMHAWFNGFDYLVKKHAEPFWNRNKKHLLLGEAIKILRKAYAPHKIDYYELKAVVNMRNKFSHFETDALTIDNLRSLKSRLFGYKNTDGLFYKLVNLKK
ncbi:MAG: hypothetical protein LBI57_07190 [Helicobacteraceae bacterium]|jgi:hypothetical protein|nr:hypothetical protein [Helicobacteraceae bacterium]